MMETTRKVSKVVITEDGLFHDGQVPGDYEGPKLTIEVVHSITFVDERGTPLTLTCYAPQAMDETRALAPYKPDDMVQIDAPTAEDFGNENEYTHRLPERVKNRSTDLQTLLESDGATKVTL